MFASTMQKGFHMSFRSGLTISVQWGPGNYCANRYSDEKPRIGAQSQDAEIAIFTTEEDRWFQFNESRDTVLGWQSADQVAEWIVRAASGDLSAFGSFEEA